MRKLSTVALALMAPLSTGVASAPADPCRDADQWVRESGVAYKKGDAEAFGSLNTAALNACPEHPEALNNLGLYFEEDGQLERALDFYRAALRVRPDFAIAWYGLGDVYRKQGQLPLALEAYLHACRQDEDAGRRIAELLREHRYRVSEVGQVLNQESLRILFDAGRWKDVQALGRDCRALRDSVERIELLKVFQPRASTELVAVFRNLQFATGSARMRPEALTQINEIAAALVEIDPDFVRVDGHTDRQPFKGYSAEESDRRNQWLSRQRAKHIKQTLVRRGVDVGVIQVRGLGSDQPLDPADTSEAYAKNRRVEITVH